MTTRINVGCGQTPTTGWRNFDNSISLRLARSPRLSTFLYCLGLLRAPQREFIRFAQEHAVEYGDVTRGLPLPDASVEVFYSSHMLEHLDPAAANTCLREALRVLKPGGYIRIAVPDLALLVDRYRTDGDADAFMEATLLCAPAPRSLKDKLHTLIVGSRHHLWLYDGPSLSELLSRHGFDDVAVLPAGKSGIPSPTGLDLSERADQSVYVEARKPRSVTTRP